MIDSKGKISSVLAAIKKCCAEGCAVLYFNFLCDYDPHAAS
jgi:hypothetical protein